MANNEFVTRRGLISLGGITFPYVSTTATYIVLADDYFIDGQSSGITITLPSASISGAGKIFVVKNTSNGNISVTSTSGNIDGLTIYSIFTGGSITCTSNGTNWLISAGLGSSGTS